MAVDIWVCVQTIESRSASLAKTEASLQASDVGTDYEVFTHPPGITLNQFMLQILERGAQQPAPLVVRLEDDVRVNRHFLANVRTWPALKERDFGIGWLFVPRGMAEDPGRLGRGLQTGTPFRTTLKSHCSQAVLFKRADLPAIIKLGQAREGMALDLLLSGAATAIGRRLYLHLPTLADHDIGEASTLGHEQHAYHHTADGTFDLDWRRPA